MTRVNGSDVERLLDAPLARGLDVRARSEARKHHDRCIAMKVSARLIKHPSAFHALLGWRWVVDCLQRACTECRGLALKTIRSCVHCGGARRVRIR